MATVFKLWIASGFLYAFQPTAHGELIPGDISRLTGHTCRESNRTKDDKGDMRHVTPSALAESLRNNRLLAKATWHVVVD